MLLACVSKTTIYIYIFKRGGGVKKGKARPEVMASGKYEKWRRRGSVLSTVTVHVIIHIRPTHANDRTLSKEEGPEMTMGSC